MDRFNALGRGAQIMLVAGVLLLISLFLPWQDFLEGDIPGDSWSGWHGAMGVLLGLATIALVAWLIVRLLAIDIRLPLSTAMTSAILGGLVLVLGIIKLLTILGDEMTIWAWIGTILAIAVGVGAWLEVQAAGGIDTLRSEIPSSATSTATTTTTTTTTTEAPPPPPTTPTPESAPTTGAAPTSPPETTTPPTEPEAPYDPDERRDA